MNNWKFIFGLTVAMALCLTVHSSEAWAQFPVVSYYPAPAVSYYPAPTVAYYPAPVSVTSTRYGVFGLRQATTVNYGYPVAAPAYGTLVVPPTVVPSYYAPAPVVVRSSYWAPRNSPVLIYP